MDPGRTPVSWESGATGSHGCGRLSQGADSSSLRALPTLQGQVPHLAFLNPPGGLLIRTSFVSALVCSLKNEIGQGVVRPAFHISLTTKQPGWKHNRLVPCMSAPCPHYWCLKPRVVLNSVWPMLVRILRCLG